MVHFSIGIDAVEIRRFRALPPSEHPRFYERAFSESEFQYCLDYANAYPHFAGIFAAKEAIFKAVNNLLPLHLSQISIQHEKNGRPVVRLGRYIRSQPTDNKWSIQNQNLDIQVSITHARDMALAWALAFSKLSEHDLSGKWNEISTETGQVVLDEFLKNRRIPATK